MQKSFAQIDWPTVFVVEYRNGTRERMLREKNGVRFQSGDDFFMAWPVASEGKFPSHRIAVTRGRLCLLEDVERIEDESGTVLWSRGG